MKLVFLRPDSIDELDNFLAIGAYEKIWQEDEKRIVERLKHYTGLDFAQDTIEVVAHAGQSMSGYSGVPMQLNIYNDTIVKKRCALIHELGHRLLFGHGLYAPDTGDAKDSDEIRVLLFQGDVLNDLYGSEEYAYWADTEPGHRTEEHIQDMRYVLSLSKAERGRVLKKLLAK